MPVFPPGKYAPGWWQAAAPGVYLRVLCALCWIYSILRHISGGKLELQAGSVVVVELLAVILQLWTASQLQKERAADR